MDLNFMLSILNEYLQYIHLFFTSLIFGSAAFLRKVIKDESKRTIYYFFSEIVFSLCAGYLAFRVCMLPSWNRDYMWLMVAVASWSGSKFLDYAEAVQRSILNKVLSLKIKITVEDDESKENDKPDEETTQEPVEKNRFEDDQVKKVDSKKFRPTYKG